MLHLNSGVHFNEEELAVLVQEFERAGAPIADLLAGAGTSLAHTLACLFRNPRGWRFFHHFLVAPLHRTVSFAEMNRVAMVVGEHLEFHVPGLFEIAFHVDLFVAERRQRLGPGDGDGVEQGGFAVHHPHATATAAACGLDDDRVADIPRAPGIFLGIVRQGSVGSGDAWHARLPHGAYRRDLVAHQLDGLGVRSDKYESALLKPVRQSRRFRTGIRSRDVWPRRRLLRPRQ